MPETDITGLQKLVDELIKQQNELETLYTEQDESIDKLISNLNLNIDLNQTSEQKLALASSHITAQIDTYRAQIKQELETISKRISRAIIKCPADQNNASAFQRDYCAKKQQTAPSHTSSLSSSSSSSSSKLVLN